MKDSADLLYLKAWTYGHAGIICIYCISVIDLLDVADVHVVQYITALSQCPGESSDQIQHGKLLSIWGNITPVAPG